MTLHNRTALEEGTCMKLEPLPFRKPYVHLGKAVDCRLHYRSYEHVVTEHILAAEVIRLLTLRVIIIHRTAECKTLVITLAGHCIDIRCHHIALTHCLTDHICVFLSKHPRLLVQSAALRAVRTHHRAESAVLKPSCVHLRIDRVTEVSSDVVAPVSVEHI